MVSFFKKLLPNVTDRRIAALLFAFLIPIATVALTEYQLSTRSREVFTSELSMLVFALWLAVWGTVATRCGLVPLRELKQCWLSLVGLIGVTVLFVWVTRLCGIWDFRSRVDEFQYYGQSLYYNFDGWFLQTILVWLVGIFVSTKIVKTVGERVVKKFSTSKNSSAKALIAIAIVLFVLVTINNISRESQISIPAAVRIGLAQFAICFTPFVLMAIPGWIVARFPLSLLKAISLLVYAVGLTIFIAAISGSFQNGTSPQIIGCGIVYWIVFIPMMSLTKPELLVIPIDPEEPSPEPSETNETDSERAGHALDDSEQSGHALDDSAPKKSAQVSFRNRNSFPTLWGYLGLIVLVLSIGSFVLIDIKSIFLATGSFSERLELARKIRVLQNVDGAESIATVSVDYFRGKSNALFVATEFKTDQNNDYMKTLDSTNVAQLVLSFRNVHTNLETEHTRDILKFTRLSGGTLTTQQLADLANKSYSISIESIEFESSGSTEPAMGIISLELNELSAGNTKKALSVFDSKISIGRMVNVMRCELDESDWEAICKFAEDQKVNVYLEQTTNEMIEILGQNSPNQLNINIVNVHENGHIETPVISDGYFDKDYWRITLRTMASQDLRSMESFSGKQCYWDTLFGSRGSHAIPANSLNPFADAPASKYNDFHWCFEVNEQGKPTKLFCPAATEAILADIVQFNELEVLSFEETWLDSRLEATSETLDFSKLKSMTQLKRLYFSANQIIEDYRFLKSLPELEVLHFQDLQTAFSSVPFDAKWAPNLKEVVILQPTAPTLEEMAKLPKLQSITLITNSLIPADIEFAKQNFGDRLRIVSPIGFKPEIPKDFLKHLQKVRESLRRKYLDSDKP